jgi:integrase
LIGGHDGHKADTDMKKRITTQTVKALKAPPRGNHVVWDDQVTGFGARITATGAVAYVLRYVVNGQERRMTLGKHPDLSASAARDIAIGLRGEITSGHDPLGARRAGRAAPTVQQLSERYLTDHVASHNKPSTEVTFRRLVDNHIVPKLGKKRVADVTSDDVAKLHHGLRATPRQANQTLAVLSKMFSLAELWRMRRAGEVNPCRGIRRYPERRRDRFLNDAELKKLGETLSTLEASKTILPSVATAVRLLALTGCRLGEVLGLRWDDVDLEAGLLVLRDAKAGGRTHVLGAPATALLIDLNREGPWVIASPKPEGPMSVWTMEGSWRRIREAAKLDDVRLHDLRHTVGTFAGQAGANAFLVRDALGHRTLAMTGRYVSRDDDPLRLLADRVSGRIAAAMAATSDEAKVVPIKSVKGTSR